MIPTFTGDVSRYTAQAVLAMLDGVPRTDGKPLAEKSRLNIVVAISGVFQLAVLTGLTETNPCKQVDRSQLVPQRRNEER